MSKNFALLGFVFFSVTTLAQTDTVETPLKHKKSFLALPVAGYGKEKGFEFGAVSLYTFYTDYRDTLTRNSSLSAAALYSTKKQSNISLKADVWQPGNKIHLLTELKFRNQPFNFYGIGNNTTEADKDVITQQQIRVAAELEKKTGKYSYSGFAGAFENYNFEDKEPGGIYSNNQLINDSDGGSIFTLGLLQTFDSRDKINYTEKGGYARLNINYSPDVFGGENFSGFQGRFNGRLFKSLSKKTILAFNAVYQTIQGRKLPFYLLPQLGNDEIMRGYYAGRYRQQNLIATQAELRYRFIPLLGMVAFAGTGTVYKNGDFTLQDLKPNYGGGFRYFFDRAKGLSIRFDYGFGEKLPDEKRQTGFYVSFSEAF